MLPENGLTEITYWQEWSLNPWVRSSDVSVFGVKAEAGINFFLVFFL